MWSSSVEFPRHLEPIVSTAIKHINEEVFYTWKTQPVFRIEDWKDENTLMVTMFYERLEGDNKDDCMEGHEALELTHAFIRGVIFCNSIIGD